MSYYTEDRPNTLYFKAVGDLSSDNLYKWAITTDLTGNYVSSFIHHSIQCLSFGYILLL